jgi:hypothetical protein
MKVFISWSGAQSKAIAQALHEWIPDVIQTVEPWMSAADINAGTRWAEELARELQRIRFGIFCMTAQNLTAPWMLYEAGALSRQLRQGRVCPYLFGVGPAQLTPPFSQFQAVSTDKDGTKRLMQAVNKAGEKSALSEQRLVKYFENSWPDRSEQCAHRAQDHISRRRPRPMSGAPRWLA